MQNVDLGSHFLKLELFHIEYLDAFFFAVSLFNLHFRYKLKTVCCIKDVNEIIGPVEHSPQKLNPNIFADPDYENIWKIFAYFKYKIHNEGLPVQFCYFLEIFRIGHQFSSWKMSSFYDRPFMFFAQKCPY